MLENKDFLEQAVLKATRDVGISMLLFRNSLAKKLNLSLTESLCLTYLGVKGGLTPSELSRLIGLQTGSTTTMLDRLEKMEYVRRVASSIDRRKVIIELTDHYKNASQALVGNVQKEHKDLVQRYTADELSTIFAFLREFTMNLTRSSEEVRDFFEKLVSQR